MSDKTRKRIKKIEEAMDESRFNERDRHTHETLTIRRLGQIQDRLELIAEILLEKLK